MFQNSESLKRYSRIQPYNIIVFGDFWESNVAVFRLYLRHKRSVFALMTSAWRALSVLVRRNRPEVQTRSGNEDIHDCKKGFFFQKKTPSRVGSCRTSLKHVTRGKIAFPGSGWFQNSKISTKQWKTFFFLIAASRRNNYFSICS